MEKLVDFREDQVAQIEWNEIRIFLLANAYFSKYRYYGDQQQWGECL
jgi:hypothetical protein